MPHHFLLKLKIQIKRKDGSVLEFFFLSCVMYFFPHFFDLNLEEGGEGMELPILKIVLSTNEMLGYHFSSRNPNFTGPQPLTHCVFRFLLKPCTYILIADRVLVHCVWWYLD
eukprot:TRINITY_DN4985_c0_g1_i3.p2 TRINITY_DN4985_c0_g1~~TRINITY_DN4985_c0_g1_i3.p2  ORF type:complete len:112 (-),score=12.33 TRINITY_DN4985_c0_g1_i3:122-457(-)